MGRYDDVPIAETGVADGSGGTRQVRYLLRRPLVDPRDVRAMTYHPVRSGDRLDLLAARYLSDPLAWWQVADANVALDPDELTADRAEGDLLVIPMPGST